ncbi:hypothetical protein [Rhizobium sp. NFR03]|uniref:hypothetical protein n=1 Tax=Rhizobium sp. NFR03 TaxID=1566263 RepID=UPI0008B70587|nr:hypothetical protein [Rhizobium sp. NFR03]SES47234.1 hypothetical protein SAMN03159406_04953 [Rhizobium sp. NFR03]
MFLVVPPRHRGKDVDELMFELQDRDKVTAVFTPKHSESLVGTARSFIGREGVFTADGMIAEGGQYDGQWRMRLPDEWQEEADLLSGNENFHWISWCPQEDLEILGYARR